MPPVDGLARMVEAPDTGSPVRWCCQRGCQSDILAGMAKVTTAKKAPAAARGRRAAPPAPAPVRSGRRDFAPDAFPPDRYRLVEIELGESLADWIMTRRESTPPVPYSTMAFELIQATGHHITNEAVRRWAQHLEDHPEARKPYHKSLNSAA